MNTNIHVDGLANCRVEVRLGVAREIVPESGLVDENRGVLSVVCKTGTGAGVSGIAYFDV